MGKKKEMPWSRRDGLDEYLESTRLCDSGDEEVRKTALKLVEDAEDPKTAAASIFRFVRDEITYGMDVVDVEASHTLRTRLGDCILKATLQIALLRCVGIPSRYRRVGVRKEFLRGVISGFTYRSIPNVVDYHPYCECYLSGRWVACEALFDKRLFTAMQERGFLAASKISTIDWTGENDLIVVDPWLVKDFGGFGSLDDLWMDVAKRSGPRILQRVAAYFSNRHTNGIRGHRSARTRWIKA